MRAGKCAAMLAAGAMLAGCSGQQEPAPAAKAPEAALAGTAGATMKPGLWRSSFALETLEVPGAPAMIVDTMKNAMSSGNIIDETCMTAADTEGGFAKMMQTGQSGDCTMADLKTEGGKISGKMTCTGQGQGTPGAEFLIDGTQTDVAFDMKMSTTQPTEAGGEPMRIVMRLKSERVGECPA